MKFTYSLKALEKQTKTIEAQGRKQIDAIMNKKEGQVGLVNNDGKYLYFKEIFDFFLKKKDLMK